MSDANGKLTGKLQFRNLEGCERRATSNRPSLQLKAPEIDAVAANGSEGRITLVSGQRRQHPGAQYLGFGWGVRTGVGQWAAFLPAPPQVDKYQKLDKAGQLPQRSGRTRRLPPLPLHGPPPSVFQHPTMGIASDFTRSNFASPFG